MLKRVLIGLKGLFFYGSLVMAQESVSQTAKISLLTVSSGDALYSAFGHTGIRVQDPSTGLDVVFNYGTFDFNTEGFYLKFMRGQLNYRVAIESFEEFIFQYQQLEKRSVWEQNLNLSPPQVSAIWQFLRWNYRPENRFYRYDFFFDNCATRPRDVFERVLKDSLAWRFSANPPQKTFRDLLTEELQDKRWAKFGIDLVLGQKTDRLASYRETMFLPEYLMQHLDQAQIKRGATWQPFVTQKTTLVSFPPYPAALDVPSLIFIFLAVCTLGLSLWRYRKRPVLAGIAGLETAFLWATAFIGLLILLLWLATDHKVTVQNWNLVWANPFNAVLAVWMRRKAPLSSLKSKILWVYLLVLGSFILMGILLLLPQTIHTGALALAFIVWMRIWLWLQKNGVSLKEAFTRSASSL